ncbi:MAG: hypothetical protein AAFP89_05300 [Bacteroidota bacterium]
MKNLFQEGDKKIYTTEVTEDKLATFNSGPVHPVYGTFALGRDAEWAGRLFVLDMIEHEEEFVGAYLDITHISPALLGSKVRFEATFQKIDAKGAVHTLYEAYCGDRLIAKGKQIQHPIDKQRFQRYIETLSQPEP